MFYSILSFTSPCVNYISTLQVILMRIHSHTHILYLCLVLLLLLLLLLTIILLWLSEGKSKSILYVNVVDVLLIFLPWCHLKCMAKWISVLFDQGIQYVYLYVCTIARISIQYTVALLYLSVFLSLVHYNIIRFSHSHRTCPPHMFVLMPFHLASSFTIHNLFTRFNLHLFVAIHTNGKAIL